MRRKVLFGVLFCLFFHVAVVGAQDSTPTLAPLSTGEESVATLEQLGLSQQVLEGPVSTINFYFGIPATWELESEAVFQLNLSAFFNDDQGPIPSDDATVEVYFNDQLLETITISEPGDQTQNVRIPLELFDSARDDGRHKISLTLSSLHDCDTGNETIVVIHPTSELTLPHEIVPLEIDLTQFPYPLYQGALMPEQALLVLPESPTEKELQAALNIAAGLGSLTGGDLPLDITTEDILNDEMRDGNHLILVGQVGRSTLVDIVDFPLTDVELDFFSRTGENDGLVQMAVSPWDDSKVVMQVGGFTDSGIIKASQAVSAGPLRPYIQDSISIVSGVQTGTYNTDNIFVDRTLADMGYSAKKLASLGANSTSFQFFVSPAQSPINEAYLDLVFTHTRLANQDDLSLTVKVNDELISSASLNSDTANLQTQRFFIPKSVIRSGVNQVEVTADFDPLANCSALEQEGAWLTIFPDSMLHLSPGSAEEDRVEMVSLLAYPQPFASHPTLSDTAFVLPPDNLETWRVAIQLAFEMGRRADIFMSDLGVSFGDEVDQDRHLIVVGMPSEILILELLNDVMPLPFVADTNTLLETNNLPIDFREPEEADVGYLELFHTPWNENMLILTVLGNTQTGLEQAASILLDPGSQNLLWGNVAIADATKLSVANSSSPAPQILSQPTPILNTENGAEMTDSNVSPPWILPAMGVSTTILVLIIVVVALNSIRRRLADRREP